LFSRHRVSIKSPKKCQNTFIKKVALSSYTGKLIVILKKVLRWLKPGALTGMFLNGIFACVSFILMIVLMLLKQQ